MKPKYITKECKRHGEVKYVLEPSRNSYRCTKCRADRVSEWRRRLKQKAIDYKGGKCEKCGYNKCNAALEFHHLNPDEKDFAIGSNGHCRKWETIKSELDKCIMVCSNCHKEINHE